MRTPACVALAAVTACDGSAVIPPNDYDAGAIVYGQVTTASASRSPTWL